MDSGLATYRWRPGTTGLAETLAHTIAFIETAYDSIVSR
jgi:hypothetical protein